MAHSADAATTWTQPAPQEWQTDRDALYATLVEELDALLTGESDPVANAANAAAAIYHSLPALNWAGFYFLGSSRVTVGDSVAISGT